MKKKEKNQAESVGTVPMGKLPKKRCAKMFIFLIIIAIIAVTGFLAWSKILLKFNQPKVVSGNLIDQYRQELPDLKKQAGKSGSAEDLQKYGIAQYATGDAAGAIETYTKQIEKESNSVIAHAGLANALRDQKNFEQAIQEYKKVIGLAPADISAYVNLASVYQYQLKQIEKAIEVYKQGIDKNSKSVDLYLLLAMAYEQSNDSGAAKKTYEKVIEIDEGNAVAKAAMERLGK